MNYKGVKDIVYTCNHCANEFKLNYHRKQLDGKVYCSKKCQKDEKERRYFSDIVEQGNAKCSNALRGYLTKTRGYKCEWCNISEWNNKPLILQVDHINGDPGNNFPDNLRLLCPNCHSQTPTYKGGNKKTPKMDRRSILHRNIYKKRKWCSVRDSNPL